MNLHEFEFMIQEEGDKDNKMVKKDVRLSFRVEGKLRRRVFSGV